MCCSLSGSVFTRKRKPPLETPAFLTSFDFLCKIAKRLSRGRASLPTQHRRPEPSVRSSQITAHCTLPILKHRGGQVVGSGGRRGKPPHPTPPASSQPPKAYGWPSTPRHVTLKHSELHGQGKPPGASLLRPPPSSWSGTEDGVGLSSHLGSLL